MLNAIFVGKLTRLIKVKVGEHFSINGFLSLAHPARTVCSDHLWDLI